METIGLMAAMATERNALLRYIQRWKTVNVDDLKGVYFELPGNTCILVTSGMGVQRACAATRKLIHHFSPQFLVSFGIAGAVEDDLHIGDVIAIGAVCHLRGHTLSAMKKLRSWSDKGMALAQQELAKRNARLFTGTAVTTKGNLPSDTALEELEHPVLEMETAAIAQVAEENGIPLCALRAISDGPSEPIPFDLGEMMDDNANLRVSRLLMEIVRHPQIALKFPQLQRNARIAADRAAIALVTLLERASLT
jgi:adenosylhomocysteine/aminodeoxyfutalosine nucleosidase